ncbi:MAG: VWA domain-containing protein [Lachnospiraceae bacterium]|nr:VWA domain-containing protein [Lachnospiraceae bacterium]
MKKYVKKVIALGLMGAMLLTGCGSSKSDVAGTTDAAETEEWEAADTEESAAAEWEVAEEAPAEEWDGGNYEAEEEAVNSAADLCEDVAGSEEAKSYLESCYEYEPIPEVHSNEEYSEWEEKGFTSVQNEPLSTFSADVDTASYSNLRRLIREGYDLDMMPEGAVRIEEMINYFSYNYEDPKGSDPFGVTTQISSCPWNEEAELLMVGLKTEDINYDQAPPSNLVFLLDVSGSMYSDDKLPLLQEAFGLLAENLTEKDRVSIVTYAGDDQIVLKGAKGNQTKKIKKALNSLEADGSTNGSAGIETAYALAESYFIEGGNNRVIIATDGDLNVGLTTEEELKDLITEKKESGIFLSVLGFGTGNIKDNKMETLADKGNGNYAYIDCLREANKVLVEEMSATLLTICKDVKFQVEFNPAVVESYRLLGYENRALAKEDFNDDTKDAGEIGAGHSVTALYEIVLKEPLDGSMSEEEINRLKYSDEYKKEYGEEKITSRAAMKEWLTISIRYKKPSEEESNLLEYPVGYECYTNKPSDDFIFVAAVAEFGLLASHSAYPEDASVKHVEKALNSIRLNDEYKEEFLELVEETEL